MTELAVATSAQPTPLAAHFLAAGKQPSLAEYRGAASPRLLDAPETEIEALARSAAVHDLGWLRRVAVRGEDRFRWLSGMVTNTVRDLASGCGAWNLVLNAQGRILGDLTVWRDEDNLEIVLEASQYDRLLAHLNHVIIMDDVELIPLGQEPGAEETTLGLTGPAASQVLTRMGLPTLPESMTFTRIEYNGLDLCMRRTFGALADHYELWTPIAGITRLWRNLCTAGATPAGFISLDAFRIAEGIPVCGTDIAERDLPQETSQMRALHFSKGCYLGQEIVERIRSRGNVHRHLRIIELDGPLPAAGAELTLKGAAVGRISSAAQLPLPGKARTFALAMLKAEAEAQSEPLTYLADGASGVARILAEPPSLTAA
ncbi:MAG: folate-binding protein YgfZ [Acidobacteriota bacterium]|nr:folate-binding protein YgfZ [Acidobacteriota bacterium]